VDDPAVADDATDLPQCSDAVTALAEMVERTQEQHDVGAVVGQVK
jgi:hypothetical protein